MGQSNAIFFKFFHLVGQKVTPNNQQNLHSHTEVQNTQPTTWKKEVFKAARKKLSTVVMLLWNNYKRKNSNIDQHIMANHPTITLTLYTNSPSFHATTINYYRTIKADGKQKKKKVITRVLSINRFTVFITKCLWANSNFSMELKSSFSKKFEPASRKITKANIITRNFWKLSLAANNSEDATQMKIAIAL